MNISKEAMRKLLEDCWDASDLFQMNEFTKNKFPDKETYITTRLAALDDGDGWRRYRFQTKSVDDYRPIVFNPKFPFWCSGYKADMSAATIVAYLPITEDLKRYWDDAFDIDYTDHKEIEFSDRFPKPDYYHNDL